MKPDLQVRVLQRHGSTVVGMSTTIRTITGLAIIISRTKQQSWCTHYCPLSAIRVYEWVYFQFLSPSIYDFSSPCDQIKKIRNETKDTRNYTPYLSVQRISTLIRNSLHDAYILHFAWFYLFFHKHRKFFLHNRQVKCHNDVHDDSLPPNNPHNSNNLNQHSSHSMLCNFHHFWKNKCNTLV